MRQWISIGAALALAACGGNNGGGNATLDGNSAVNGSSGGGGGDASDGNASIGEAPGAGATAQLRPGQWQITTQVTAMNMPNMPTGVQLPMPPPTTVNNCLTPEQASQPNANFWTGSGESGGCTYQNSSMAGGRIQGVVQCNTPQGSMRSTMNGQFSGDSFELTQQVETNSGGQSVTMTSRTTGRRTGDCTG